MANALRSKHLSVSNFRNDIHTRHTYWCRSWFSLHMDTTIAAIILQRFHFIGLFSLIWNIKCQSKLITRKWNCGKIKQRSILLANHKQETEHLHASDCSAGAICRVEAVSGRNRAPNAAQFSTIPESTNNVPRHPYSRMNKSMSGAKMNVPNPLPATAIPVQYFNINATMWEN